MNNEGLTLYLSAFIDELVHSGLRHIVISPGSRSTPLALLASTHPDLQIWMNIDERSAGFFALGMAKAKREAVALLCTSGTAAANYLPAVIEAKLARVPLVVLTADRPHELRDVGAPQTINQIDLYGDHVKWFMDMPLPEDKPSMIHHARATAARAMMTSVAKPYGPVHLNFPLREPLLPNLQHEQLFTIGRRGQQSFTKVSQGVLQLEQETIDNMAHMLSETTKGVIICGPHDDANIAEAVLELANLLQFPIIADPLSQLRRGFPERGLIMDSYDAFLRYSPLAEMLRPELVIRIGAMPVSKSLSQYLQAHPSKHIIIDEGDWRDPAFLGSGRIVADPVLFCQQLCEKITLSALFTDRQKFREWTECWQQINQETQLTLTQTVLVDEDTSLFEGRVVTELGKLLPADCVLFVGNSMPIRDVDSFLFHHEGKVRLMANRGSNGIDGLVSTAAGVSAAGKRTVLLLGDLSFYHDMNGLLATKLHQLSLTIILVNNDGGGIFSFLPQATVPQHFETLFGTPTGLDYSHAVSMYGGKFERVSSWEEFRQAFSATHEAGGLQVIEVPTDRSNNVERHQIIWSKLSSRLEQVMKMESWR